MYFISMSIQETQSNKFCCVCGKCFSAIRKFDNAPFHRVKNRVNEEEVTEDIIKEINEYTPLV